MGREILSPQPKILISDSFYGKHKLQFNEKSHRYKLDNKPVVGTTTFIKGGYPTSIGLIQWMKGQSIEYVIKWFEERGNVNDLLEDELKELFKNAKAADRKVSQEAADIGTLVHDFAYLTELGKTHEAQILYDRVVELPSEVSKKAIHGIDGFKDWKEKTQDVLELSETLVASIVYSFCGKFDRLARRKNRLILSDFKTAKSMYLDQIIQLAAYRIAIREWLGLNVEGLEVLRFGKEDGEFETLLIDDPKELQMFEDQAIRCRQTYELRKLENDPRWDWKKRK